MTRINQKFNDLKSKGKTAFIGFTMAGDPNYSSSLSLIKAMPKAGVDLIEIGVAFSDPMADGPTIQNAGIRALKNKINLPQILQMVTEFRKEDNVTPIILMGYYNPIYKYGIENFVQDAKNAGVDGLIIVDLPIEESKTNIANIIKNADIDLIQLITPTTTEERIKKISDIASGFLYYVSVAGITGSKKPDLEKVQTKIKQIRKYSTLPIATGFGIKTKDQVETLKNYSDAIIIGSAICNQIEQNIKGNHQDNQDSYNKAISASIDFIQNISSAL